MDALGLNLGYLLVQVLNFAIVFVVLRAWVYKPILNMLEQRKEKIAQSLEDARKAEEARQNAESEAAKILDEARSKANELVREASSKADQAADNIKAEANQKAKEIHQEALKDAEDERKRILTDVRGQVAALAIAAAQKLIGEAMDQKKQQALVDEFFSSVKQGKVVVLADQKFEGKSAVITSALPLTDKEKSTLQDDILKHSKTKLDVTFEVDPSILGGLKIQVDDMLYDHSVASQLAEMRDKLS
ncbi:MAG: F0F1 ATP synthase subunit B [Anaerolineales bacterium]